MRMKGGIPNDQLGKLDEVDVKMRQEFERLEATLR
jgi:hypothetical protein